MKGEEKDDDGFSGLLSGRRIGNVRKERTVVGGLDQKE